MGHLLAPDAMWLFGARDSVGQREQRCAAELTRVALGIRFDQRGLDRVLEVRARAREVGLEEVAHGHAAERPHRHWVQGRHRVRGSPERDLISRTLALECVLQPTPSRRCVSASTCLSFGPSRQSLLRSRAHQTRRY
eukprot:888485-Rhodomonas_salina.3